MLSGGEIKLKRLFFSKAITINILNHLFFFDTRRPLCYQISGGFSAGSTRPGFISEKHRQHYISGLGTTVSIPVSGFSLMVLRMPRN